MIAVRGLVRGFGATPVLDGLDLDIAAGEFVALLGRSGSGKTTLLRLLAALDRPDAGCIEAPGERAMVFQEPRLLPWKRVLSNVALGLGNAELARTVLEEVGLGHRLNAWPLTLSGGEAQRVGLARALARRPALLLLDEPFASLDALTRLRMQRLVAEAWARRGCAVLLVTHDVDEALLLADRVLVLESGRIGMQRPVATRRPRSAADAGTAALKAELLAALGAGEAAHGAASDAARRARIAPE